MQICKKIVIFAPKIVVYYTNNYCPLKKTREHTYNKNYRIYRSSECEIRRLSQKITKITLFTTKIAINCSKLTKIILLSVKQKLPKIQGYFLETKIRHFVPTKIYKNQGKSFVFSQRNAARCIGD